MRAKKKNMRRNVFRYGGKIEIGKSAYSIGDDVVQKCVFVCVFRVQAMAKETCDH